MLVLGHFAAILLLIDFNVPKVSMSTDPAQANWTHPAGMTPAERLDELAHILAAGLIRMFVAQSSSLSAPTRDSFVDFSPPKSGGHRRKLHNRVGG